MRLGEQLLPARRCTADGVAGSLRLKACASSSSGWLPRNILLEAVPTNKQARPAAMRHGMLHLCKDVRKQQQGLAVRCRPTTPGHSPPAPHQALPACLREGMRQQQQWLAVSQLPAAVHIRLDGLVAGDLLRIILACTAGSNASAVVREGPCGQA